MRKNAYLLGVILAVLALLLLGVAQVAAAEKTEFSCTETPVSMVDPGTWAFPDGNVQVRGMVHLLHEHSSDPRIIGANTVVMNANWDADMTGPMWGTFYLVTSGGGWEGTWAGQMTEQGSWYNAAGDGFGDYTGLKLWIDMDYGVCQGEILEH